MAATDREVPRSIQRMSGKCSRFFRANLGQQLDAETRERFDCWARAQPRKHVLTSDDGGNVILYAERDDDRPAKSHMVALRTLLNHNWKIPLKLPSGFLELLSREDFDAALSDQPSAPAAIVVAPATCRAEHRLLSLSPGFDDRARRALDAIRAVQAAH